MEYKQNNEVYENVEEVKKGTSNDKITGYLILGGIGVVSYIIGSRIGYSKGYRYGLTHPIIKNSVEKIDYSEAGKIIAKTITASFGFEDVIK